MVGLKYRVDALTTGSRAILRELEFSAGKAESVAVVGESGSGKTMLAMSILGLLPPGIRANGLRVVLDDTEISALKKRRLARLRGRKLIYIPQSGLDSLNPFETVREHFGDAFSAAHIPRSMRAKLAESELEKAGLDPEEVLDLYPFEISGGMAQKVTLALSSLSDARLVIADEPTNGLDPDSRAAYTGKLYEVFHDAVKLIITHDISLAASCDSVIVMCGGYLVEYGPAEQVLRSPLHPYTKALIESLPANGLKSSPMLRKEAGTCPFFSRCPHASETCAAGEIQVHTDNAGRRVRCTHA